MGNPSAAHEPSMEEILASIRQIISEDGEQSESRTELPDGDEGSPTATADAPEQKMAAGDSEDETAGEAPAGSAQAEDNEPAPIAAAAPHRPSEAPQRSDAPLRDHSVSSQPDPSLSAQHRSADKTAQLPRPGAMSAAVQHRPSQPAGASPLPPSVGAGGERRLLSPQADASVSGAFSTLAHTILAQNARTLEDLVSEMLRPMLKEWLDDNLPPLVERLVKDEIERVSRGRH